MAEEGLLAERWLGGRPRGGWWRGAAAPARASGDALQRRIAQGVAQVHTERVQKKLLARTLPTHGARGIDEQDRVVTVAELRQEAVRPGREASE